MAPSTLQIPNPRQPACTSFLIAPVVADYTADVLSIKNGLRKNDLKKRGGIAAVCRGRSRRRRESACVCVFVCRAVFCGSNSVLRS